MRKRVYTMSTGERERIRDLVGAELAGEPAVAFAYLYGSFLESEKFHDVDIGVYLCAVEPNQVAGPALSQRLSARVRLPVDVRILNGAPVSYLYHVLRGQLVLSNDDNLLAGVMEQAVSCYLDIAPLLRHSAKEAFAA